MKQMQNKYQIIEKEFIINIYNIYYKWKLKILK